MKVNRLLIIATLSLWSAAYANKDPVPQSGLQPAILISSGEIAAAVKHNGTGALSDSVLRVIPIASKYNIGVAVVRRSRMSGHMPPDALVHEAVTEVYQIIEGRGVMVTGGVLQSPRPIADAAILGEIGPSSAGQAIVGGARRRVGPGDIVVIPAGTPHGFLEVTTARIVYTIIRIDPLGVLHGKAH
ncbi:MAG: hypothetical protein ACREVO_12155 [Steroidobacteraceae bacterium]